MMTMMISFPSLSKKRALSALFLVYFMVELCILIISTMEFSL